MNWPLATVSELLKSGSAHVQTGPFGTQLSAAEYVEVGHPVINVRNVGYGSVRDAQLEYVDDTTRDRLSGHILQPDDIVFGRKGAVDRHAFLRPEHRGWVQGSDCIRLRIDPNVADPRFISYALLTERHKTWMLRQCSHGATMASLNQGIVGRIEFLRPPLPTQRRVAGILSAYDDLIGNNTKRIKILEEMARALYGEWFVHFRFPGHEKVKLVDSPLGQIPEGWEVGEIGDTLTLQRGFDLPKKKRVPGDVPIVSSSGVSGFHSESKIHHPAVITGRYGTLGKVFVVLEDCWPLNTTLFVKDFKGHSPFYCAQLLRSLDLARQNVAGAVPGVNRNALHKMPLARPPTSLVEAYGHHEEHFLHGRRNLELQNKVLGETRDLLLPRLISGEIDVDNLGLPEAAQ